MGEEELNMPVEFRRFYLAIVTMYSFTDVIVSGNLAVKYQL